MGSSGKTLTSNICLINMCGAHVCGFAANQNTKNNFICVQNNMSGTSRGLDMLYQGITPQMGGRKIMVPNKAVTKTSGVITALGLDKKANKKTKGLYGKAIKIGKKKMYGKKK
eukprot:Lithocolla_globosa_v1_NODE_8433_length_821_cov_38.265013.p2 type:complete len:113 gc:universal NODE_8433_length_821_cov_38.265013:431-93(-)